MGNVLPGEADGSDVAHDHRDEVEVRIRKDMKRRMFRFARSPFPALFECINDNFIYFPSFLYRQAHLCRTVER